ncbi:MAG: chromate transporter, partial [Firmicutes bacterium]|nr:chromate transporter [Bacillota bacterium]
MSENTSKKENIYLQLFIEFFTLGLFTFGGGYAMIGLLEERMTRRGWLDSEEILDCIAVTQTLPGVIAVNMSLYVGYRLKGIKGALVSVFGMVLPSFVIIIL